LGLVSIVEAIVYFGASGLAHPIALTGLWAMIPAAFIATSIVTRINATDDIPYIIKNIQFAISGEDQS